MSQQLNLFETMEDDGFFDESTESSGLLGVSDDGEPEPILTSDERWLGGVDRDDFYRPEGTPDGFDLSLSPEEAFEGVGATSSRAIGGFNATVGRETDRFDQETSPPGMVQREPRRRDPTIESNIAVAESAGVISPRRDARSDSAQLRDASVASTIEGAKQGHQEAIEALVQEAGWDRSEARALAQEVEDPASQMTEAEFQRIVDAEISRSQSNGRFVGETKTTPSQNVDRRVGSGRFVSSPQVETDIGRDRQSGRFTGGDSR